MLKRKHSIIAFAVLIILGMAWLALRVRETQPVEWTRLKLRFWHSDYLAWKERGGPFKEEFGGVMCLDPDRDNMVAGLDVPAIRAKFPFLVDGDGFAPSSYRGEFLAGLRKSDPAARVFWFDDGATWGPGWCVMIENGRESVVIVKG